MRSTAQLNGHPLHPALIAFPVAFLYGALLADLAALVGDWPALWATGAFLSVAAVVSGLVAAVPGLIDYLYTVPPDSSAKNRATWHMVVNSTALAAFAVSWAFRDWATLRPDVVVVVLEAAGVSLITWGGYLGGILVYRNQIGVDHRYAHAGKWREERVKPPPSATSVTVAKTDELKRDQLKLIHVGDRRIVLARTEDGYVAFSDHCTHRGGSLAGGVMARGTVICPWHGSQFDAESGAVVAGPAEQPIVTYRVEQKDGEVRLLLPTS
jgi:nitrite reductase/ring-hydroxylating ferredoxin subunit/uncharacterized membrane protein